MKKNEDKGTRLKVSMYTGKITLIRKFSHNEGRSVHPPKYYDKDDKDMVIGTKESIYNRNIWR